MLQCVEQRWRLLFSSTFGNRGNHCALNISRAIVRTADVTFLLALDERNARTCCFAMRNCAGSGKLVQNLKRLRHENNRTSDPFHEEGLSLLFIFLYYCK